MQYILLYLAGVFISSVSQILLKLSSQKEYPSKLREYLNPLVIAGYALMVVTTLTNIIAYKKMPLSLGPVLGAMGYVFITVLSAIIFKEKVTLKRICGLAVIIAGVCAYSFLDF